MDRMRLAVIDLGTVSSRLLLAEVEDGAIVSSRKRTVITDLGEGVDATGRLAPAAIGRVVDACAGFKGLIGEFAPRAVATTLTSAARDAENGRELVSALEGLGLAPQVIEGEVEAALTFFGVARDFEGGRIAVADSGGGSTELVVGSWRRGEPVELERAASLQVGCRRMTERFWGSGKPSPAAVERAAGYARGCFEGFWDDIDRVPGQLVAVGGTVTTLVAMARGMKAYDSSLVHLSTLGLDEVDAAIERLGALDVEQIASLPGIQPKRAPVILGGAVAVAELMRAGGYTELVVSENSLMAGMVPTIVEAIRGSSTSIGWSPRLSW